jgi:RHS repeat-associated protein
MREGLAWQPALRPPSPAATACRLASTTTPRSTPSTGAPSKRPATAAATAGASQVISQTVITYTYDALNRLTAADYSDGSFFHYAYDANGNRLSETTQAESNVYTYDDANRLTSANGVAYTWDANGNLLSDGVYSHTYDGANRLTGVTDGVSAVSYASNGLGDRLQTTASGQTTRYTLDLVTGLTQVLDDGGYTYLYGNGRVAQYGVNGGEYFLGDALGSVRQLADAAGAVRLTRSYQPYGSILGSAGDGLTSYGFTGEWTEGNTQLVYLRTRWYSPGHARFISRDTWEGNYFLPITFNGWQYAYANPTKYSDPSGLDPNCKHAWPAFCAWSRLVEIVEEEYPNGAEALFRLFEDKELLGIWGDYAGRTSSRRLEWILSSTQGGHGEGVAQYLGLFVPLQFGIEFGNDCGFAKEFRDTHLYPQWGLPRSASNQVGHFLTAVALTYYTTWRKTFGLSFIIGHEMFSDEGLNNQMKQVTVRLDDEYDHWFAAVKFDEQGIYSERDKELWSILNFQPILDPETGKLVEIQFGDVDPNRRGNSLQDLRLSLKGYRFALWVLDNKNVTPLKAGKWLRKNLGSAQ